MKIIIWEKVDEPTFMQVMSPAIGKRRIIGIIQKMKKFLGRTSLYLHVGSSSKSGRHW